MAPNAVMRLSLGAEGGAWCRSVGDDDSFLGKCERDGTPYERGCQYPHVSSPDSRRDHVYTFLPNYEAPSSPCAVSFDLCLGQSDGHHLHQFGGSRLDRGSRSIAMDEESISNDINKGSIFKKTYAESNGPLKMRSGIAASSSTAGRNTTNSSSYVNVKIGKHHRAASHCAAPRVCSSCYTTKTPLWRSGPQGPKSLCNACGIRRIRRARRTTKTAGAAVLPIVGISPGGSASREPIGSGDGPRGVVPFKKRCKFDAAGRQEKLPLEELALSLGKSTAVHRLFPQEEKDAAVLLMSLSCGLIHG